MKYIFILSSFFISTTLLSQIKNDRHILYEDLKTKYQAATESRCDTFRTHVNDESTREKIRFLNKDFSTTAFSRSTSSAYWHFIANDTENQRMHIGMVSILFNNEKEKKVAIEKIESSKRTNFKVKLLTKFKVRESKNELLIIFTETVHNKSTSDFWKTI